MNNARKINILVLLVLLGLLAGCAVPSVRPLPDEQVRRSDLLSFIQDGVTTRDEVLEKLNIPYAKFEGERILTYILRVNEDGGWQVTWNYPPYLHGPPGAMLPGSDRLTFAPFIHNVPYSDVYTLVLVFDHSGVLEKHSLVGSE